MIRITDTQFESYLQRNPGELTRRLYQHLLAVLPDELRGLPERLVLPMIDAGVARARGHGLRSDEAVCGYVTVMFEICPNFDQEPLIQQVLGSQRPADERWQALFSGERALVLAWEHAAHPSFYDPAAWLAPAPLVGQGG